MGRDVLSGKIHQKEKIMSGFVEFVIAMNEGFVSFSRETFPSMHPALVLFLSMAVIIMAIRTLVGLARD